MHTQHRRTMPHKPAVNPRWRARGKTTERLVREVRTELGFARKTRAEREREMLDEM